MTDEIQFADKCKRDAVALGVEGGYAVSEVSKRHGVSHKSVYTWKEQLAKPNQSWIRSDGSNGLDQG